MSSRALRSRLGPGLASAGVAALGIDVLGTPATLVLAGGWLLSAALGRVRALSGPASWAAGIAVEYLVLFGGSGLLALASGHEHGAMANRVLLAIPAVLGAAGLGLGARRRGAVTEDRGHPVPAMLITVAGLLTARWVAGAAGARGAAWAMSGDGRNHVQLVRNILADGGITVRELRGYPALVNSISALLSGAGGRRGLRAGDLMLHDARAVAATFVLAGIALGCLFAAALFELLPAAVAVLRRLPVPVGVVGCAAGCLPASAVILGTALHDGFLSAYGALPLGMAAVVLTQRLCRLPSPPALALLGPVTVMSLVSWTPLATIPAALSVTALLVLAGRRHRDPHPARRLAWPAAVLLAGGGLLVLLGVAGTQGSRLIMQFRTGGSSLHPQPQLPLVLTLVAVAALFSGRRLVSLPHLPGVVAGVAGGATAVWMRSLAQPSRVPWPYYSSKMLWLVASMLLWLAFLPALAAALGPRTPRVPAAGPAGESQGKAARPVLTAALRAIAAAASAVAVFVVLEFAAPVSSPLPRAHAGWVAPQAQELDVVRYWGNQGRAFVLWDWAGGGNDRLANYWATLSWAPAESLIRYPVGAPGGAINWSVRNTNKLPGLCELLLEHPGLVVVTRSAQLGAQLATACPAGRPDVVLSG